jgi:hypothetical protein
MNGLAAFREVLARARNGVAAREERGSGDQNQSDESRHVFPLWQIPGAGSGDEPDTQGYRGLIGASTGALHESYCKPDAN